MIKNRKDFPTIKDACGKLQELYTSENMSISYATIAAPTTPHLHRKLEEVYFIIKGRGSITIGDETYAIEEEDTIPIPKGRYHQIIPEGSIELVVVTYPKFDKNDLIPKE